VGVAAADLRAWLKQRLPRYMVPAAFVLLPALPLTPNGKVNRKALPAPESETRKLPHELPSTPIESIIAEIWTNVLKLTSVGIDDDFFDLGGHSLLAVRVMGRINQALEVDLNLRQLFETPTVRGLALAALDSMVAGADEDALHGAGAIQ
jgi:acyl carrier protein